MKHVYPGADGSMPSIKHLLRKGLAGMTTSAGGREAGADVGPVEGQGRPTFPFDGRASRNERRASTGGSATDVEGGP